MRCKVRLKGFSLFFFYTLNLNQNRNRNLNLNLNLNPKCSGRPFCLQPSPFVYYRAPNTTQRAAPRQVRAPCCVLYRMCSL